MPYSSEENADDVVDFVIKNDIRNVLDVGAGSGTYGKLLRPHIKAIHAVEVWKPYIDEFDLNSIYDSVQVDDIRNWPEYTISGRHWDLIIFGDILEHMSATDSMAV